MQEITYSRLLSSDPAARFIAWSLSRYPTKLAGTGPSGAQTNRQRTPGMVMRQTGPQPSLPRRTNYGTGRQSSGSLMSKPILAESSLPAALNGNQAMQERGHHSKSRGGDLVALHIL